MAIFSDVFGIKIINDEVDDLKSDCKISGWHDPADEDRVLQEASVPLNEDEGEVNY